MRQLAGRLQSVREEERARISREIHDELGHQLTGLSLNLGWLRDRLGHGSEVLAQQVDYMLSILDSTWGALRRISTELRPAVLDQLGLPAAVQWQCDDFREHSGIAIDLDLGPVSRNVAPEVATTLFRVLQEALTNVSRHSGARHVEVTLRPLGDHLVLVVVDDGHGFDPAARAESITCGLFGMEQRAQELNGHLSLESAPGQGTRVEIRVPLV
jgi:signal transduction histidine kinase